MNAGQLIELLSEMDPGDEVRIATQPEYPLAFEVAGVVSLDADPASTLDGGEREPGIVWISTGDHPDDPYAPPAAFAEAEGCW